jgi:hypothetical protein
VQFKDNADVFMSDDRNVGKPDRVVIDPRTKDTAHIALPQGIDFESLPDFEDHYIAREVEMKRCESEGGQQ